LTRQQTVVFIAAMMVIPWIRSTLGVILPKLIDTYDLTISQAGLVSIFLESGSVTGMLSLGFVIDRIGAARIAVWGLPVIGIALFAVTEATSFGILAVMFFFVGIGVALTASGVNTLMATTGKRRAFYLGLLHSCFSVFAIATPLIAGALLTASDWQTFYFVVAAIALFMMILFRIIGYTGEMVQTAGENPLSDATGPALRRIATVCLGVFALAGVQGVIITWSYLYMVNVHGLSHGLATLAPSLLWVGILVMRSVSIALSRRHSERTILLWSIAGSMAVVAFEQTMLLPIVSMTAMILLGMGVAGAFQLGTAWAAERIPGRIGTASSAVMASAALGIGVLPWVTGITIDATDYSGMMVVSLGGMILAASMFGITAQTK